MTHQSSPPLLQTASLPAPATVSPAPISPAPEAAALAVPLMSPLAIDLEHNYRISTPQGLYWGIMSLSSATLLFTGLLFTGIRYHQQTVQDLSQSFVPSLAATQRIEESLAALDTNLVQILLAPEALQTDAKQAFEEHRQKIANDLLQLNQSSSQANRPMSQEERRQTTLLQVEFGRYLMAAERAKTLRDGQPSGAFLPAYETALTQLEGRLLPAAIALRQAQNESFTATYGPSLISLQRIQRRLLLLIVLVFSNVLLLQLFLSYRTQRTLNPALLLATLLMLQFSGQALGRLRQAEQQLQQATAISTQTLQFFADARSQAYLAHSYIGRSLLRSTDSGQSRLQFHRLIYSSLNLDPTTQMEQAEGSLARVTVSSQAMAQAFSQYQEIAHEVLRLQPTQPQKATDLATGYRTGQLNAAFEVFKEEQRQVVSAYQAALDQTISQSLESSTSLVWRIPFFIGFFLLLVALGTYPRLREYSR